MHPKKEAVKKTRTLILDSFLEMGDGLNLALGFFVLGILEFVLLSFHSPLLCWVHVFGVLRSGQLEGASLSHAHVSELLA